MKAIWIVLLQAVLAFQPRGSFGSLLHLMTFGLFGNQKERVERHVEGNLKVQERKEESKWIKSDKDDYEEEQ